MTATVTPISAALPELVGYVEAMTADRIFGWAWSPASPQAHASIELRLGSAVVGQATADTHRPDLESNGIGDGRHAYELTIPEELRGRTADLRVFARIGQGTAVAVGTPPAGEGVTEQMTRVTRGIDMLLNSQRVIHRNLQTALTKNLASDAPVAATLEQLTLFHNGIKEQLATIERFVVRFDEQLARLSSEPSSTSPSPTFSHTAIWALCVAGVALVVSTIGLVHSLGG